MRNILVLVTIILLTVATGFFVGDKIINKVSFFKADNLLSPVDSNLVDLSKAKKLTNLFPNASNLWSISSARGTSGGPLESVVLGEQNPPQINAESAILIDLTTNKVLFEKNSKIRRPVASTLKIMTALVALERAKPDDKFKISQNAATTGEDTMGVSAGETYTFEELLYGLMLPSGNDAATAISENVAGSVDNFVKLMNQKAKLLGLVDTKFVNPTGLEGDGEHYSTAADLAVISRTAYKSFPLLQQIVATPYFEIYYNEDHKYLYLENQTNLLTSYPGVKGFKPGYTPEAGLCLVTIANVKGHEVLGIVLGSQDRRGDMELLLNYSSSIL